VLTHTHAHTHTHTNAQIYACIYILSVLFCKKISAGTKKIGAGTKLRSLGFKNVTQM